MTFDYLYNKVILEFSEGAVKKLIQKFSSEESEQVIRNYLEEFEKYKNGIEQKDPFQYKTFIELSEVVDAAKGKNNPQNKEAAKSELSSSEALVDDNDVTIYKGDTEQKCVKYGRGYPFCISRVAGGNMFGSYRLQKASTFYFIFFKNIPKTDDTHIMVLDRTKDGWEWTFANNATEEVGGWDEIVKRFPVLAKYESLFVNNPLSQREKQFLQFIKDFRINQSLQKFNTLDYQNKTTLVKSGFTLNDDIFDSLDNKLRNEYISTGTNLTPRQAEALKPNEISRYVKVRELTIPQLIENGYYKLNKHDINTPVVIQKIEEGKRIAEYKVKRGDYNLSRLFLTELPKGIPQTVKDFYCYGNQLTTLQGAPQTVEGSFDCSDNQLKTLQGAPQTVGWSFDCSDNQLTTLQGAPQTVEGSFYCRGNQLTTLQGAPQTVEGGFYCNDNPVPFTEQDKKQAMEDSKNRALKKESVRLSQRHLLNWVIVK